MPQVDVNISSDKATIITASDITLDPLKKIATRDNKNVKLTKKESALLEFLIQNKDKILTRKQLLKKVWDIHSDIESRTLDVYIGYLRKKIDKGFSRRRIFSVRGLGYILKTD